MSATPVDRPDTPVWHLRRGAEGWHVERDGADEPAAILPTRGAALRQAHRICREQRARLVIYQANGIVERDYSIAEA